MSMSTKRIDRTKRLNRILFVLALLSVALFVFSLFFSKSERTAPKPSSSALLNPNNVEKIDSIKISVRGTEVLLSKSDDFWHIRSENSKSNSLVDTKLVSALISNASRIREIYKISSDKNDFSALGLSGGSAISFLSGGEPLSAVIFGISDALSGRIAFRTFDGTESYETEDDFSQFLTVDADYWIAGEFFYEIASANSSAETIKLVCPEKNIDFKINSSDSRFPDISHSVMSLRHGKVCDLKKDGARKIAEIEVHSGNGEISVAEIWESKASAEPESLFVTKKSTVKIGDDSAYELSEFTFNRIIEIFGGE